jgi:hypothetical protein
MSGRHEPSWPGLRASAHRRARFCEAAGVLAATSSQDRSIEWLLSSDEPAVRLITKRELLHEEAEDEKDQVVEGPKVRALLAGQQANGGFGVHPYRKWTGAFWRLASLVELEIPAGNDPGVAAAETVLDWLTSDDHRLHIRIIDGLTRSHATQEGIALAVCCRLGLHEEDRVRFLARSLIEWQWPDGGWNCDVRSTGRRSSFHETLGPMWGLCEYWKTTGDRSALDAARRAAELFLEHRLFRSRSTGEVIHSEWTKLHYPPYWHYDVLQALLIIARLELAGDPRAGDALDVLERKRLRDGRWRPGGYWWRLPGSAGSNVEIVDWGRGAPNEMITLNALRVLRAAGRRPI